MFDSIKNYLAKKQKTKLPEIKKPKTAESKSKYIHSVKKQKDTFDNTGVPNNTILDDVNLSNYSYRLGTTPEDKFEGGAGKFGGGGSSGSWDNSNSSSSCDSGSSSSSSSDSGSSCSSD